MPAKRTLIGGIAAALLLITFIFYIVAQANQSFGVAKFGSTTVASNGLWGLSLPGNCRGNSVCNKIKAARAFFVMATIAVFVAGALLLYIVLQAGYPKVLYFVVLILALIAFLFGLIGWAIGMDTFVRKPLTMGAASALGLIGWLFSLVALILAVLMKEHSLT